MPALATHFLCGNAVLELMNKDKLHSLIMQHRNIFNLGTQGPDIFFYRDAWPHSREKNISKLGEIMHEEKTGAFILNALKFICKSWEPARSMLTAYICGFVCHYVLDCHTHPYIFYKTGFLLKGEVPTDKYTCFHRRFETALDVLMLKGELGLKPSRFNVSAQIRIPVQAASEIGQMCSTVLHNTYGLNTGAAYVCDAIADISNIAALLRDKTGIKKLLLSGAEKVLGKLPMFSSMILPGEINDGVDYLNATHDLWYLPWDNSSPLTSSFKENFDAAVVEAKSIIELIELLLSGKIELKQIGPVIGNRSYSTGRDCSLDLEFRHFDCVYD